MAASWIKRVWDKPVEWEDIGTTTTTSDHWYTPASTSSCSSEKEDLERILDEIRKHQGLNEVEVLRAKLKELQKENKELKEFIEKWAIGETDE